MVFFANLFLVAFALDGLMSLADVAVRAIFDSPILMAPRVVFALLPFCMAPLVFLSMAVSVRLPTSVLLMPIVGTIWLNLGALPLAFLVEPDIFDASGVAIQLGIAALSFAQLRLSSGRWLLPRHASKERVSMRRLFAFSAFTVVCAPIAAGAYGLLYLAIFLEQNTDGFLAFDLNGINIGQRQYRMDDSEVQLIGMMHIGERSAYDDLFESFSNPSTLVLEEGVSDDEELLSGQLSYSRLADALGLEEQRSISEFFDTPVEYETRAWPHVRNADIDVAQFSPTTIAFLEQTAGIWNDGDLFPALLRLWNEPISQLDLREIENDIIWKRNESVLVQLEASLGDYQHIIVPWGALHLPGIARELEALGFERTHTSERRLVSWMTLATSLLLSTDDRICIMMPGPRVSALAPAPARRILGVLRDSTR